MMRTGGWTKIKVGEGPGTAPGCGRPIYARVSKRVFELGGTTFARGGLEAGQRVRVTKLHGCPPPGTMGQYHVAHPETGELLGMVSGGALRGTS